MNCFWVISGSKKVIFFSKKSVFVFFAIFVHFSQKKRSFRHLTTFFETPITQKRFIFEESKNWYGKRKKSCTLIVVKVVPLYLLRLIYNLSAKSNRTFYLPVRKYYIKHIHTLG